MTSNPVFPSPCSGPSGPLPLNPLTVSIILVNWNSKDFVAACLRSITDTVEGLTHEIFVVDNASFDGCGEMIAAQFPDVQFLQCRENLGFAGANNLAFARSRGRTILFLNPDTEVQQGAIQALVAALDTAPGAGMVGARLLNSDFTLQTTCVTALPSILNQTLNSDLLRHAFPRWRGWGMRALYDGSAEPVAVEAISGACMLGTRDVFERVGAFSTAYFMYAEDMDLSLKVARAGAVIYYVPSARIVHHAGGSSSRQSDWSFSDLVLRESLVRFFAEHRGAAYAGLYRVSIALMSVVRLLVLVLASPVLVLSGRRRTVARAANKWFHILLWSIGLQPSRPASSPQSDRPSLQSRSSRAARPASITEQPQR